MSKISILKDVYLENRFIYNKLEAILFEEMRRIDLLWEIVKYTASLLTGGPILPCVINYVISVINYVISTLYRRGHSLTPQTFALLPEMSCCCFESRPMTMQRVIRI
jgi:hypothetical protein